MSDYPDTDAYAMTLENGDTVQVVHLVDEVEVTSSKRIQLERFEPIEEEVTLSGTLPDYTSEDRMRVIEGLSELTCDICERNLTRRYEAHVRAEAFGDD